ncbi:uncharacterized protein RCC_01232 [Ramularia collo-cygni]|uniref:Uncharacterized protein n=1 Tax=Ramularia collo-cygni TaxID=112498 RepID=A0A2D3V1J8_9PEZI|nr:uncharacterized protein RCC_01232 [Ramularia collo-cygni]CZT15369.1 uncharacterized protein RCC_01232 [Ramularia collo-cygni]
MADRDSFEANPPAEFLALSVVDQKSKLKRRREIESRWNCDIRDCMPLEIRPRVAAMGRGAAKAKIRENVPVKPWWQCSVRFLTKLGKIAEMTVDDLDYAQDLMTLEVEERQRRMGASSSVAEIVLQDLDCIIKALPKTHQTGNQKTPSIYSDDDSDLQQTEETQEIAPQAHQSIEGEDGGEASLAVETEVGEQNIDKISSTPHKRQKLAQPASLLSKIAALRGKAMRREHESYKLQAEAAMLNSEAAKLEAEAYEHESSWILQKTD